MNEDKFKYIIEDKYIRPCDSCHSKAPLIEADKDDRHFEPRFLCQLCYASFIGNATKYRSQYDNVSLFVSIAQVGNIILDQTTNRTSLISIKDKR